MKRASGATLKQESKTASPVFHGALKPLVAILALQLSASVLAQTPPSIDPGAIQRQEQERQQQREREQRLQEQQRKPDIQVPGGNTVPAAALEKNIRVERFDVDSSAILSAAEIEHVLAPYRGRLVSLADLQEAVATLNQLYDAKHQPTARAFLPPQTITGGIVRIRLVESKVGAINITGNKALDSSFVSDRLHFASGDLMSVPQLESDLIRFNRLNENQLRASVLAGKTFGTTDVDVNVIEAKPYRFSVFADNAGRDTVGEQRVGFNARAANLTGHSDSASVTGVMSKGSDSVSAAYSTPLTRNDLRLDVSYTSGNINIVDGPFVPLDITGRSSDFTVGLSKPLLVNLESMWTAYSRMSWRKSISKFGAYEQQNQDLRVLTLGLGGEHQSDKSSWYVDQFLAVGIHGIGGEEDFNYYRANATRIDRLSDRTNLVLRGGLQLSDTRILPASEQFQLGGSYSVRGFSEGLLSGRNGYFTSIELRVGTGLGGFIENKADAPNIQGLVFIDHGGAFPYRAGNLKEVGRDDFLTSAGLGTLFDWGRLSGRVIVAQPINHNPAELHDYSPRWHVSLTMALD